jgi:hypothetical protein
MTQVTGYDPYVWLIFDEDNRDWLFQQALSITFVRGLSAAEIASRLALPVRELDLSDDPDALFYFIIDGKALFDADSGWAVLYEDNGLPHESTYRIAEDPAVDEAVLVFTNVNSVVEFGYWRAGDRLVGFEFPSDRYGSRPDALLDHMHETTGLLIEDYEHAMADHTYLPRMMTLAERITSTHLDRNFLRRRLLAVDPE